MALLCGHGRMSFPTPVTKSIFCGPSQGHVPYCSINESDSHVVPRLTPAGIPRRIYIYISAYIPIYIYYLCIHMYVTTMKKRDYMNFKDRKEGYMGGLGMGSGVITLQFQKIKKKF